MQLTKPFKSVQADKTGRKRKIHWQSTHESDTVELSAACLPALKAHTSGGIRSPIRCSAAPTTTVPSAVETAITCSTQTAGVASLSSVFQWCLGCFSNRPATEKRMAGQQHQPATERKARHQRQTTFLGRFSRTQCVLKAFQQSSPVHQQRFLRDVESNPLSTSRYACCTFTLLRDAPSDSHPGAARQEQLRGECRKYDHEHGPTCGEPEKSTRRLESICNNDCGMMLCR